MSLPTRTHSERVATKAHEGTITVATFSSKMYVIPSSCSWTALHFITLLLDSVFQVMEELVRGFLSHLSHCA